MSDLIELSSAIIDGRSSEPANRLTLQLGEVTDDVAVIESFSNVVAIRSHEGLTLFDTSLESFAMPVLSALRTWSDEPVHTIVYTHGHVDHVGGAEAIVAEAAAAGRPAPHVVAHAAVPRRFDRYRTTSGYNGWINARQFGGSGLSGASDGTPLFPVDFVHPTRVFEDRLGLSVGHHAIELHHDKGETDDHAWAWLPDLGAVACGDLFIWCFPNAGNPQKVQRYPLEWARALRRMLELEPRLLLPAHGLPISGADRIATVLGDVAGTLESLVSQTLEAMNAGLPLDDVVAAVHLDPDVLDRPWLAPIYDEPEFVVRNTWRLYGGWYDGNPSRLKPARDAALASEVAALSGGATALVDRAAALADVGDDESLRLACHLVEFAVRADPDDVEAQRARADIYAQRREGELSLMARGIFGWSARQAERNVARLEPDVPAADD